MSYFQHPYASNSDLKELVSRHEGREKPDNLEAIFDFGSAFHAGILEPHKLDTSTLTPAQVELVRVMSKTFWKDEMCRNIAMAQDFKREHEFYRQNRFGIGARCKVDGVSKKLRIILELKGLSVTSEKQFKESVLHLGYDQGCTWYLNTSSSAHVMYQYELIAGISKIDPEHPPFKLLLGWDHQYYKTGIEKVKAAVHLWKNVYGFK